MRYSNEQKLWQSVVLTAVRDALSKKHYHNKYYNNNITDAQNWLLNNKTSYFSVCDMANIDPITLREKVKFVLSLAQDDKNATSHSNKNHLNGISGAIDHDDINSGYNE